VEPDPQQEKAIHKLATLRAESVGVSLQRGIEAGRRGEDARREAEGARGVRALSPRVRLIAGGRRGRKLLLWRRGRGRNRDLYPFARGGHVRDGRGWIGRTA